MNALPSHRLLVPVAVALAASCSEPVLTQSNDPPLAVIRSPSDGETFDEGEPVNLRGEVTDDKSLSGLTVEWLDNGSPLGEDEATVDDEGNTELTVADLTLGSHAISLRVVDADNLSFEASVTIDIIEAVVDPTLTIVRPASGERGEVGIPFTFEVEVGDPNSPPDDLDVEVNSDLDSFLCTFEVDAQGVGLCSAAPTSQGDHRLTFTATDPEGNSRSRSTVWTVDPVPEEPSITIDAPTAGSQLRQAATVTFEATVVDRQDPPGNLLVTVTSDIDGEICQPLADAQGTASCLGALPTLGTHRITFEVEDTDGNTDSAQVLVQVSDGLDIDDDGDGYTENQGDCDDSATGASVYPGAPEQPNGRDDNCNDTADEGTVLYDDDGDGYCESQANNCTDGTLPGDCNDSTSNGLGINPGAVEQCGTPADDNCSGTANEAGAQGCTPYYQDADGDTFGDPDTTQCACTDPGTDWVLDDEDCDDSAGGASVNPLAPELPNGADDNCNDVADEGTVRYDDDGDGYCEGPVCTDGTTPGDCDDTSGSAGNINPGRPEICGNAVDEDCSGNSDDGFDGAISGGTTYYVDNDGDGFGDPSTARVQCGPVGSHRSVIGNDCYDDNGFAYPGNRQPGHPDWFDQPRGDASFDYNCSNGDQRRWTAEFECGCVVQAANQSVPFQSFQAGWDDEPACGETGTWVTACQQTVIVPGNITAFEALIIGGAQCLIGIDPLQIAVSQPRVQECR